MSCAADKPASAPMTTNLLFQYLWRARRELILDVERFRRGSTLRRVHPSRVRTSMQRVLLCAEIARRRSCHRTIRAAALRYVRDMPPLIRFWVNTMPPKTGDADALTEECREFEEKLTKMRKRL